MISEDWGVEGVIELAVRSVLDRLRLSRNVTREDVGTTEEGEEAVVKPANIGLRPVLSAVGGYKG